MKKEAFPIYLFSFLMILPFHGFIPVLPLIRDEFNATYSQISIFVGSLGFVRLVLALPSGFLVDRFNRKNMLLFSGAINIVGLLLMSFSQNIFQLVLSRVLIGASSIICSITILVLLSEIAGPNEKGSILSMNNVLHNAGGIISPTFAGLLSGWYSWRLPFLINAGLIVMSMPFIFITIKDQQSSANLNSEKKKRATKPSTQHRLKADLIALLPVFFISLFVFFYRSSFRHTLIPFYGRDILNFNVETLGFYISLSGFTGMISILICGYLADRFGRKKIIIPVFLLSTMAVMALLLPVHLNPFLITTILLGTGAFINSVSPVLIADRASPESMGKLFGVNRIFADSGYLIGSLTMGGILDYFGFRLPLYVIISLAAVTIVLVFFFVREQPHSTVMR